MEEDEKQGKPSGLKSGFKTSEFWIALLMNIGGFALVILGHENVGGVVMAAGGGGYQVSRGMAKKGGQL